MSTPKQLDVRERALKTAREHLEPLEPKLRPIQRIDQELKLARFLLDEENL